MATDESLGERAHIYNPLPSLSATERMQLYAALAREVKPGILNITLRSMQCQQPWNLAYSKDFQHARLKHKDFAHALVHIMKAAGNLAAYVDNLDHGRTPECSLADVRKWTADLVNCALRLANTCPDGAFDLQTAVIERIEGKNNFQFTERNDNEQTSDSSKDAITVEEIGSGGIVRELIQEISDKN